VLACAPKESPPGGQQRNVLLIVSDALRQDVLGCYAGEARTPNIDWLAENGVLFENAYANSNWTAPSSVTLLTGNYPTTYEHTREAGTFRLHVPEGELVPCEVLRESGYTVMARVNNVHATLHNNLQGFDPIPPGKDYARVTSEATRREVERIVGQSLDYDPYSHVGAALAALLERPADAPFFMLQWILDPHEPYRPIDRFKERNRLDASGLPRPGGFYERPKLPTDQLSDLEKTYVKRLYVAEVESVDERVGFLIEMLRHEDLLENTYIIFTADHGEMFGEHGQWGHHAYFYDALMRIPLIVVGPGVDKGVRAGDRVSIVDIMPTLRDLLGVDYEHEMQGRSFRSLLTGGRRHDDAVFVTNIRRREHVTTRLHRDALISGDFKLITLGDREFELYDLAGDPGETHDLAASRPDLVRSMYERIELRREENEALKARHLALAADTTQALTDEEREAVAKELRALGYIK